ncbi:DUF2232 domain-containing protein [Paenibacillus sp. JX-17]|uniref:DUF2232 domain-containing protein n=1 Tax=Paenibacillus lacisoli TaxID=3064525 RepID=A0ABT9CAA1_9BACL|nr:DUF2232 domain-containing protein [Paenibacillus sp. JX-17]MDO7906186.1 DUF2232 domain-containing protein [Paenibacillus sp. JX-17]
MNILKFRWSTAVWSIIFLILLLSLGTPLSVITLFLLIVPGAVLYAALPLRQFIWHIVPVALIALILDPLNLIRMISFIIPSIVMGHFYKRKASAFRTIMAGMITLLAEFLLLLIIGSLFFQFDLSQEIRDLVSLVVTPLQEAERTGALTSGINWSDADTELVANDIVQLIPFTLILTSLIMSFITHIIVRPNLESLGHAAPKLPPARLWRLPRSLIGYYLLAWILELITHNNSSSTLGVIGLNLMHLVQLCFLIQAIGFCFFLVHERKWHPALTVLLVAVVIIFQNPLRIVGIIDLAFPLREAITRSKR